MTVDIRSSRTGPPPAYIPRHALLDAPRPTPLEWARRRRTDGSVAGKAARPGRVKALFGRLGAGWHVLDTRLLGLGDQPGFLVIGPGGVYSVTVAEHGRSKVMFAGDVVQIRGGRPPLVREARARAVRIAEALSLMAGTSIPVVPIIAFAGSGPLVFYGVPKGCIVTSDRELARLMLSRGSRIAAATVGKIVAVAAYAPTWTNHSRHGRTAGSDRPPENEERPVA